MLFIGILIGAYSSIFIATPLLVSLRRNDPAVLELDKRAARHQARRAKDLAAEERASASEERVTVGGPGAPAASEGEGATITGRAVHKYAQTGPRNQPRRTPKSRR